MKRANRVSIDTVEDGFVAKFYKTHDEVGRINSSSTDWKATNLSKTSDREDFRKYAISKTNEMGIDWSPEYQQQAWSRKYWKYETDEQVTEDAITLMEWTINKVCSVCKYKAMVKSISLDSIVPMESPISYIENGKYMKNGNWAVAQVNLEVEVNVNGADLDIIYPIEMRSGQLTKIRLTKADIDIMIEDTGIITK